MKTLELRENKHGKIRRYTLKNTNISADICPSYSKHGT